MMTTQIEHQLKVVYDYLFKLRIKNEIPSQEN